MCLIFKMNIIILIGYLICKEIIFSIEIIFQIKFIYYKKDILFAFQNVQGANVTSCYEGTRYQVGQSSMGTSIKITNCSRVSDICMVISRNIYSNYIIFI
jgi:hypothetical protein